MEKYLPLGVVGEGSYGVVLKCRTRDNGKIVAIKKFIDSEDDQNVRKIAMREIRVLRKLRHENLVNLIEVFRRRKHIYLVFEFIDHTLLDQLEQKSHGLDEETCRKYIFQILRGLGFCHDNSIIHRDVKPENVLVSKTGIVKLCDFGFARNLCGPGDVYTDYVATRWYRAPELLVGDVAYGKEVDIWAVGCLFAEMMTGEPLFPGDSDIDQLFLIAQCLGRLSKRHLNIMARNSAFRGFQYPKSRHGSTASTGSTKIKMDGQTRTKVSVFSVLFPSWSDDAVMFLTLCLDPEPSGRPNCSSLLRLPYFTHDNFPTRFLTELNQLLQQEGRAPIKTFSKKQSQRIANVSPSVPLPPQKHIQSSHPILRTSLIDESLSYKFLPNAINTTNGSNNNLLPGLNTALNRQTTFVVDKNNAKGGGKVMMYNGESRIPRKFSEESSSNNNPSHLLNAVGGGGGGGNSSNRSTFPPANANNHLTEIPNGNVVIHNGNGSNFHNGGGSITANSDNNNTFMAAAAAASNTAVAAQQETRRFSVSKKYFDQDEVNILNSRNHGTAEITNGGRQLPVTTLTFLGSSSYGSSSTTTNVPGSIKSPNPPNMASNNHSNSYSFAPKKLSPKKATFYSQNSLHKPVTFSSSTLSNNKESFLPRMKLPDENTSTSLPFLALGSPTKLGASSYKKKNQESSKWESNRKATGVTTIPDRQQQRTERQDGATSPKHSLPVM